MKHGFKKLFLLFTLTPIVELYLLFQLASYTSVPTALLVVITTGVLGAYLAKREGLDVVARIKEQWARGVVPSEELFDGLCVLVGGLMLLTPGLLTDAFGFTLLYPLTRSFYLETLVALAKEHIHIENGPRF